MRPTAWEGFLEELDLFPHLIAWCDASATIGAVNRLGPEKLQRIHIRHLCLQDEAKESRLIIKKVGSEGNSADEDFEEVGATCYIFVRHDSTAVAVFKPPRPAEHRENMQGNASEGNRRMTPTLPRG